ncbi:MAG: iron transporter [Gammaproteobacteria bacterium]
MKSNRFVSGVVLTAIVAVTPFAASQAAKIRIGNTVERHGMRIGALYIQAVKMDMGQMGGGSAMASNSQDMHNTHDSHSGHNSHADHGDHAQPMAKMAKAEHNSHGGHDHATSGDLHLEADISASANNNWGFPEGAWIPYLQIRYTISKVGSDFKHSGRLMPMIANDGPHYGDNLDLPGSGKYRLRYDIAPPLASEFHRHFDKETGVADWWKPFSLEYEFVFVGTGKKGGY